MRRHHGTTKPFERDELARLAEVTSGHTNDRPTSVMTKDEILGLLSSAMPPKAEAEPLAVPSDPLPPPATVEAPVPPPALTETAPAEAASPPRGARIAPSKAALVVAAGAVVTATVAALLLMW